MLRTRQWSPRGRNSRRNSCPGGPGRAGNGNFDLTDLHVTAAPLPRVPSPAKVGEGQGEGKPIELKLVNPKSTFDQGPHLAVALVIDGDKKSGWAVDPQFGKDH